MRRIRIRKHKRRTKKGTILVRSHLRKLNQPQKKKGEKIPGEVFGYLYGLEMKKKYKAPIKLKAPLEAFDAEEDVITYLKYGLKLTPGEWTYIPDWGIYEHIGKGEIKKISTEQELEIFERRLKEEEREKKEIERIDKLLKPIREKDPEKIKEAREKYKTSDLRVLNITGAVLKNLASQGIITPYDEDRIKEIEANIKGWVKDGLTDVDIAVMVDLEYNKERKEY
jgi:hypothetical protein